MARNVGVDVEVLVEVEELELVDVLVVVEVELTTLTSVYDGSVVACPARAPNVLSNRATDSCRVRSK